MPTATGRPRRPAGPVIGRFAPTPSGPLHFGSLLAAVGSYAQARSQGGRWLLRIEDLDPPREQPGAADSILRSLEAHGLHWDGEVLWQSRRHAYYEAALATLRAQGDLYACQCSRSELARAGVIDCLGPCRSAGHTEGAWRLRTADAGILHYQDQLRGECREDIRSVCGDFVLKRRDGLYAYQLAVVVDDAASHVTEVVRGADLLDNTARQCWLMQRLALPRPAYLHLPLAVSSDGQKLSKQNHAPPLAAAQAGANLWQALHCLQQQPPVALRTATPTDILCWAVENWRAEVLPTRPCQR